MKVASLILNVNIANDAPSGNYISMCVVNGVSSILHLDLVSARILSLYMSKGASHILPMKYVILTVGVIRLYAVRLWKCSCF